MVKKLVGVIFCMLLIIAAFVPVTGNLDLGSTDEGRNPGDTTRDWITLPEPLPVDMLLERSICRRMSFHNGYPATPVTDEELSTVLWAAYGITTTGARTVYCPNGTYSTTMYVIRSDATYIYVPTNHSLLLWKTGNYLYLGQPTGAPIKFGLVWNMSIAPDEKAGMAEIGMIAQNVYFDANALDLATITTGMSVNDLYELDLPANEKPEIIMHLGHPPTPYDFTYNPLPESNLPTVVNNTLTLADVVNTRQIVNEWNTTELTLLEESQILWCSYGTSYLYDNINHKRHRTLPSAIDIYPFKIYAANQSGVYKYTPETHSISLIVSGDKRELIENAVGHDNISVSSSPWIIVPFWDKNVGSQNYLAWWWYESGAIVHNVLLEATALNLGGNVLSVITDQNQLRSALGLSGQTNLVAMHLAMVGHANGSAQNNPPMAPSISGPSNGLAGVLYNYTMVTTDPDGDHVYYWVDWDDGTNSGWIGPFTSGTPIPFNHTWSQPGTYTIKVKAKDTYGAESIWTPFEITIAGPGLDIEITGGLGITVTINNTGTIDATNISWEIVFEGGFVIPAQKTGTIPIIPMGEQSKIQMVVLGLGKKTVTVSLTADDGIAAEKTANGFLFLVFFIGVE
ncbi:MAG: nitroreductase family protein [Thermoplasmata archaeon]|nr:nitroreductase family protein [Thermoplasmata archaeon]